MKAATLGQHPKYFHSFIAEKRGLEKIQQADCSGGEFVGRDSGQNKHLHEIR